MMDVGSDLVPVSNREAIAALDPEDQVVAVTRMLEESRAWLAHAMESSDPRSIADFTAFVATVADATRQLNLATEIQLDAQEMVRRGERSLGMAVRRGQEKGTVLKRGEHEHGQWANQHGSGAAQPDRTISSPTEFYNGGSESSDSYAMAAVTDEQFDEAIEEAKAERNLSRANVVRKVKGLGPIPPKSGPSHPRRLPGVISNSLNQIHWMCEALSELQLNGSLPADQLDEWIGRLGKDLTFLRTFRNQLLKIQEAH